MALSTDILLGVPYNVGGTLREVDAATVVDNVFTFSSDGKKWQRVFDGGNSVYRASWLNITGAPVDKSALVAIALANSAIQTLEVDTTIQIDGAVDFTGKTLSVKSGGLITGTYAISNAVIEGSSLTQKILDTTGTLTTSKSATGKWHPTHFGATGNGSTDDYAAVNFTVGVANTNEQKSVSLIQGNYLLGTNLSVPSGVTLEFNKGAYVSGSITISGAGEFDAQNSLAFGGTVVVSGISSISGQISPQMWGAVGNGSTDDSGSIQRMFDYLYTVNTNLVNIFLPAKNYYHGNTVDLPGDTGSLKWLKIDGYGAALSTDLDIPIWRRMPTTQSEATTIISSYSCVIGGFRILGNSTVASPKTNQVGLLIGAIYNWRFYDIAIQDLYTGLEIQFGLKCTIDNITGTSAWIGIIGRYGSWSGASVSNSSFNANSITNCKIFNRSGSLTSLQLLAADQTQVNNFVSEGQNPQYNIYYDESSNTGVLVNTFTDIWFESTGGSITSNTNMYIRGRGMLILNKLQRIYPNILFDISMITGSVVIVDNLPYTSNGPVGGLFKVASTQTGSTFFFKNLRNDAATFILDSSNWVGAVMPVQLYVEPTGLGANAGVVTKTNGQYQIDTSSGVILKASTTNRSVLSINTNATSTGTNQTKLVLSHTLDGSTLAALRTNTLIAMYSGSTTVNKYAFINSANAGATSANIYLVRSRGTTDTPTALQNGDRVADFTANGFDGTNPIEGGRIRFIVDGTVSTGIVPTSAEIDVMNSSGSVLVPLKIRASGQIELAVAPTTGDLTDTILTRTSAGAVRQVASTDIIATGAQYQLGYYAAAGNKLSPLTAITASRALKSDVNGLPVAFDTATEPSLTELTYVKGVTSPIQQQLGTNGLYAANGDGILTTFTVTHGFTGTPTNVQVTPSGVDSAIPFFVNNITATTFDVTFTTAPIVGTSNVTFYWTVK